MRPNRTRQKWIAQMPALSRAAGEVTAKRVEDGNKIVECRVTGINQRGELVCLSDATMMLPS